MCFRPARVGPVGAQGIGEGINRSISASDARHFTTLSISPTRRIRHSISRCSSWDTAMGGQEALQYVLSDAPRSPLLTSLAQPLRGLLLEAPYIALDPASQPNSMTVFVGRLALQTPTNTSAPPKTRLDLHVARPGRAHRLGQRSTVSRHRYRWKGWPACWSAAAQLVTLSASKPGSQSPVLGLTKKTALSTMVWARRRRSRHQLPR